MPSTATTRNRFEKQFTGENVDTWGDKLNTNFDLIDASLDGITSYTLSGIKTLSSTNYAADESRKRIQWVTGGTGGEVRLPAVEKEYVFINDSTGAVVVRVGEAGDPAINIPTGQARIVFSDGSGVYEVGEYSKWTEFDSVDTTSGTTATITGIPQFRSEILFVFSGVSHSDGSSQQFTVSFDLGSYTTPIQIGGSTFAASATLYGTARMAVVEPTAAVGEFRSCIASITSTDAAAAATETNIAIRSGTVAFVENVRFAFGGATFDAGNIRAYYR